METFQHDMKYSKLSKSVSFTPNYSNQPPQLSKSAYSYSYQQKQQPNIILESVEMENIVIGQPIIKGRSTIMTPLLQSPEQQLASNQQDRFFNQYNNNTFQVIQPKTYQLSQQLSQIKAEQFPDSNHPQTLFCFQCNKTVLTNVTQEYGCGTYSVAAVLCVLFFPCAIIPFVDKSCKDYNHYCRECNSFLGKKAFLCRLS